jgi:hypothetical protein
MLLIPTADMKLLFPWVAGVLLTISANISGSWTGIHARTHLHTYYHLCPSINANSPD